MNYFIKVLKNYAVFTGRARRSEYWYFFLFYIIISIAVAFLDSMLGSKMANGSGILGSVLTIAFLIPSIAVGVRRMHDVGKSGWYIIIPIYNLILACTEGVKGSNEYGPDPKNVGLDARLEEI
ncbi:DUF805 domain-containing protein [Dyadobacter sp. NIV53]|uniref:DUF805 domain-containing protein n=1 Tax=Dyadobacter sp. NIV53 TaxID=2861765 RepID=UPI001C87C207|nr:DUF805 domain-containing protein [Dyadobacter sp. NIV53]